MKKLLLDTRKVARSELETAMKQRGERGEVETPDYLPMLISHSQPDSQHWQTLVRVLALSRICVALGTVEAVRVLIHVYVRFDFLRIDTQLQLKKLGDRSLAALIEATHHEAASVSTWAKQRLDFIGKAIPSEVVQVEDPGVLADVLRAYGHTRDPDAARIVISFANSERAQVREAARQAVGLFRETAHWPLRDTFETMVGRKPPSEWSWDRTARELFREFDRIRLSELHEHYEEGVAALARGDLAAMRTSFDSVIRRSPTFEPRDRLVDGYLQHARQSLTNDRASATESLQRASRLAESDDQRNQAQSLLLTIEALKLSERQVADRSLLRNALELDATNDHARALLDELSREPIVETTTFMRALWPGILGSLSLVFALIVALRHLSWRVSRSD